ncbi:MAG: nucleoid-associated protein [Prosthecobacter sp.]
MLENLKLEQVVVHEVITAADLHNKKKPTYGNSTIEMNTEGRQLICDRLVDSIGSASHCEEMLVSDAGAGSPFQSIAGLLDQNPKEFVSTTASLATRLSEVQTAGSIKEGLGVFLQGTGEHEGEKLRWIAIIKADPDRGLMKVVKGSKITLQYVANLIMGAQQRLLKVAMFVEQIPPQKGSPLRDGSDFSIKLYDHLLSNNGRGASAMYFYLAFLGLKPADNSAKQCRLFFEQTREFTDALSTDDAEKVTYRGHLTSYMRSEKAQISVKDFAETYLHKDFRRAYTKKMREAKFPDHAVRRDIRLIKSKLKRQSLRFTSKIMLVGPDDAIQKSVLFGEGEILNGEHWTELKIRGHLE